MRLAGVLILFILSAPQLWAQGRDVQLANQYYGQGDVDKAKDLYDKLSKNTRNIPLIHNNYLNILLDFEDFKTAQKYIDKAIKSYPDNTNYMVDKGIIYLAMGEDQKADQYFKQLIESLAKDNFKSRRVVQYLMVKQLANYAVLTLTTARYHSGDPMMYALDLANIYRSQNKKDLMVLEYLNFANQNPRNLQYVKNTLQNLLTEQEDLESLELLLFDKVQEFPDNDIYGEMLIWVNLQLQNFYGAFIQARAIDRRQQLGGAKVLNIGMIALNNDDYKVSIDIFNYLVANYPDSYVNIQARLYRINAREQLVKNSYPVEIAEVEKLIQEYDGFIGSFGDNRSTHQAQLNKAMLHAYYQDDKVQAIQILDQLVKSPRVQANLKAEAKLELADIYLLNDEPWESTLLYSQVDKEMKESALGYEAKLRNAKLAYYRGDFMLAQSYLDILKLATSREIANDALQLSIFIGSNTLMDTTNEALKMYAGVELMLFQHKDVEAMDEIKLMRESYSGHSLEPHLIFLQAELANKAGNHLESATLLYIIFYQFKTHFLAPKAYFEMGKIYQEQLNDTAKASEVYEDFLKVFPGSIYTAEARKRFRILRGDANYVEQSEETFN